MSTKIEGIFPHKLTTYEQLELLTEKLRPTLKSIATIIHSYWGPPELGASDADPAWRIGVWGRPLPGLTPRQQWEAGTGPMLFAPEGSICTPPFWLTFGRRCLFATTGIKWGVAMVQPAVLRDVRDYFREVGLLLNSDVFILYRENGCLGWDWVQDGMSIEQIEHQFLEFGSKPVTDLEALSHSNSKTERTSYYRERIAHNRE